LLAEFDRPILKAADELRRRAVFGDEKKAGGPSRPLQLSWWTLHRPSPSLADG
jgi:hypothetical protein